MAGSTNYVLCDNISSSPSRPVVAFVVAEMVKISRKRGRRRSNFMRWTTFSHCIFYSTYSLMDCRKVSPFV
jgi:hypothetical protein